MPQLKWTFRQDNPVVQVEERDEKEILNWRGVQAYLWSRTILCPSCTGLIPLAPNWKLSTAPGRRKLGIRLKPDTAYHIVGFEVVPIADASRGTIAKGQAICPLCGYVCPKGYPGEEARPGRMGQVLYCKVIRILYPIYRGAGQKPIQGVKPLEYVVPDQHLVASDRERWRLLKLKGWLGIAAREDMLLKELGLFGGTESDFAPGIANLYRLGLHPDQDEDDENC